MRVASGVCFYAVRTSGGPALSHTRRRVHNHAGQPPHGFEAAVQAHVHHFGREIGGETREASAVGWAVEAGGRERRAGGRKRRGCRRVAGDRKDVPNEQALAIIEGEMALPKTSRAGIHGEATHVRAEARVEPVFVPKLFDREESASK